MPHLAPIFLHSSWRTGSTYVWSKFRARADTLCFFEPLNEHLANATPAFIDSFTPWTYANHPTLDAPYLEEFRPLLAPHGGLADFPLDLAYGRFRVDRTADLPELRSYFEMLARHAGGKTPVFGSVRSGLRLDWFRHHLGGVHLSIQRDPRRQFVSALSQAVNGNRYFLERGWVILGANRLDLVFAPLVELFDVPPFCGSPADRETFYAKRAWTTDWTDLYVIAYFLHLLAVEASAGADLLIDMDALTEDPAAIAEAEHGIAALTGLSISLADCRIERYDKHLAWSAPHFAEVEARVAGLLRRDAADERAANAKSRG